MTWFKSSFSAGKDICVECERGTDGGMRVRDSKKPDGAVLEFTPDEWQAFTAGVKQGEFD